MKCSKWFPVKFITIPIADRGMQLGPYSNDIWIIGLYLYKSLNGGSATYSAFCFWSSSSESLPSSSPAFLFLNFWGEGDIDYYFKGCGAAAAGWVGGLFYSFLYKHLMKPLALVLELMPKFCSAPPPKESPYSRIIRPSPVATKSASLLVLTALQRSPRVAGPPPTMTMSAVSLVC